MTGHPLKVIYDGTGDEPFAQPVAAAPKIWRGGARFKKEAAPCFLPILPSAPTFSRITMRRKPTRDELYKRAKANGYKHGACYDEYSRAVGTKYVPETIKDQTYVLYRYEIYVLIQMRVMPADDCIQGGRFYPSRGKGQERTTAQWQ